MSPSGTAVIYIFERRQKTLLSCRKVLILSPCLFYVLRTNAS